MNKRYSFEEFVEIVARLRAPGGCPWDAEQTHSSIRNEFIEETYEAVDAIDNKNDADLCEELGDVLLQILMHSQMASEDGSFDIDEVIDGIAKKMVLRHPHVFGDVKVSNSNEVLANWDKIKKLEKNQTSHTEILKSVPMAYPALMRAQKVKKRAAKAGVEFGDKNNIFANLSGDLNTLKAAVNSGEADIIKDAYGQFLFDAVGISQLTKQDSEEALNHKTNSFINDFCKLEQESQKTGKDIKDVIPTDFR